MNKELFEKIRTWEVMGDFVDFYDEDGEYLGQVDIDSLVDSYIDTMVNL